MKQLSTTAKSLLCAAIFLLLLIGIFVLSNKTLLFNEWTISVFTLAASAISFCILLCVITPLLVIRYRNLEKNSLDSGQNVIQEEEMSIDKDTSSGNLLSDVNKYSALMLDNKGTVLSWSLGAEQMTGYSKEEVLGKNYGIFHLDELKNLNQWHSELEMAIQDGSYRNEGWRQRKDGSRFWADIILTPLQDTDQNVMGFSVVTLDNTMKMEFEEKLWESEQRLTGILDIAEDAIVSIDKDHKITIFNKVAEKIFGYSAEEIFGQPLDILLPRSMSGNHSEKVRGFSKSKSGSKKMASSREVFGRKKDGSLFPVEVSISKLELANETIYTSIIRDITERKAKERKIKESEELFRLTFHGAPNAIGLLSIDKDWVMVNKRLCKMTGYTERELMETSFTEISHPDDRELHVDNRAKLLKGEIDSFELEKRLIHKNNRIIYVVIYASVVRDEKNKPLYIVYQVNDVTERKVTEIVLEDLRTKNELILNSAGEGIYGLDTKGHTTFANPAAAKMLGWEIEELLDKSQHNLIHHTKSDGSVNPREDCPIYAAFKDGKVHTEKNDIFWRKDGTSLPIVYTSSPLRDESDNLIGAVVTFRDVTEQKKLEKDLEYARDNALKAAKIKSEFLANMSHEIRTPMNGITGMTDLLLEMELSETQERFVSTIKSSADSLLTVINDILDFSKIEAGKLTFETIDFDLRTAVESVLEMLAEKADSKSIDLGLLFHPDVPVRVSGDPTRLRQVLINLVNNGIKFTDYGEVVINVLPDGVDENSARVRFEIKDTGIGISKDQQKVLFRAFMQGDASTTRKYGGTGLGLAISTQLVNMMGGQLKIESELDKGATFSFSAKFLIEEGIKNKPVFSKSEIEKLKVLIIDDSHTSRKTLSKQFDLWGVQYDKAEFGKEGLKLIKNASMRNEPYTFVLLAYELIDLHGVRLAKMIRQDSSITQPTITMVSSFGYRKKKHTSIDAYLTKPILLTLLVEYLLSSCKTRHVMKKAPISTQLPTDTFVSNVNLPHLLLVEDNEVNQTVALSHLMKLGYTVDVANNGSEALVAVKQNEYAAILMDCQMPIMDGYEATEEIRKLKGKESKLPIIAMTAHTMVGDREECLASGMSDYIAKPFRRADLGEILNDNLKRSFHKKEAESTQPESEITVSAESVNMEALLDIVDDDREQLQQLLTMYIDHTTERIDELKTAVLDSSPNKICEIAHKSKGSSSTCGMIKISKMFAEIENIGKSNSTEGVEEKIVEVEKEFEEIKGFTESVLKSALVLK